MKPSMHGALNEMKGTMYETDGKATLAVSQLPFNQGNREERHERNKKMIMLLSAVVYTVFMGAVIVFQGCLAVGMPWGAASMGGKFPGKYPPTMRTVAAVNMVVLSLLCLIVMIKAGILFPHFQKISAFAIWFVVAFALFSVVMNAVSPSKIERNIWLPVTAVQLITSMITAIH